MKLIYVLVCIGFFIYVPCALAYRLCEDFSHPERWGEDLQTDPRIYLPALGLAGVFVVVVVWRVCHEAYRQEIRWRELRIAVERVIRDKPREDK
jgi:hypothetical protein